jgi:hypothetical protein
MLRWGPGGDGMTKAFFPAALAALGTFGACGGSTTVEPVCREPANCGSDAQGGSGDVGGSSGVGGSGGVGGPGSAGRTQGGASGSTGTGGNSGVAGGALGSGPIDSGVFDGPSNCDGVFIKAPPLERDLFVLLDQSASMSENNNQRWIFVTNGIIDAVSSPALMGIGLGVGYFGLHPAGSPPADPSAPGSCNASDYARPAVPIAVLPAGGAEVTESLRQRTPGGGTPTRPALQGALQYAAQWALAHPARKTVVVLVTDGAPQGCAGDDLTTVSQIAAAGVSQVPQILTYVIAVGGVQGLDQVAEAGGTQRAFTVDDSNTRQQVLDALKQISGRVVGCEFTLPHADRPIDFGKVNVYHQPVGGRDRIIFYVDDPADCSVADGGWYFVRDASGVPASIKLCETSCDTVQGGGSVSIFFGCPTQRSPLQ